MKYLFLSLSLLFACGGVDTGNGEPQLGFQVITHPEAQFDELMGWSAPPDPIFVPEGTPALRIDDDGQWGLEAMVKADATGDFGQTAEALTIPAGYGTTPCGSTAGSAC